MPGLSASELQPESLHAGDTITYYSRAFVCGDPRGRRTAVVLRVDDAPGVDLPVSLDTEEILPLDNLMKRVKDRFGNALETEETKWRKLRTFTLRAGSHNAPTRASDFTAAIRRAIDQATVATMGSLREAREEPAVAALETAGKRSAVPDPKRRRRDSSGEPSAFQTAEKPNKASDYAYTTYRSGDLSEEKSVSPTIIDLVSDSDHETTSIAEPQYTAGCTEDQDLGLCDVAAPRPADAASRRADAAPRPSDAAFGPSDTELLDAVKYAKSIPTRPERATIRHQRKQRPGEWHVARSRKRRDLAKCAITRSGMQIHHAKTLSALKIKKLLQLPGVKSRLKSLRARRPLYKEPAVDERDAIAEVAWIREVKEIEHCVTNGISFPDLGEFEKCKCVGDCFMDACDNYGSAVYCTPDCCNLGALCSNAPRARSSLKLYDTGRVGFGVYTTTPLDVGDVIGEYVGELAEYDAVVEGQPVKAIKQNSGYTMLYNAKSAKKKFVYVEALKCGSVTRFISHACKPNAAFVEMQNRTTVKVLIKMIEDVKAGAQITVNYGKETWFCCSCDDCWSSQGKK